MPHEHETSAQLRWYMRKYVSAITTRDGQSTVDLIFHLDEEALQEKNIVPAAASRFIGHYVREALAENGTMPAADYALTNAPLSCIVTLNKKMTEKAAAFAARFNEKRLQDSVLVIKG